LTGRNEPEEHFGIPLSALMKFYLDLPEASTEVDKVVIALAGARLTLRVDLEGDHGVSRIVSAAEEKA